MVKSPQKGKLRSPVSSPTRRSPRIRTNNNKESSPQKKKKQLSVEELFKTEKKEMDEFENIDEMMKEKPKEDVLDTYFNGKTGSEDEDSEINDRGSGIKRKQEEGDSPPPEGKKKRKKYNKLNSLEMTSRQYRDISITSQDSGANRSQRKTSEKTRQKMLESQKQEKQRIHELSPSPSPGRKKKSKKKKLKKKRKSGVEDDIEDIDDDDEDDDDYDNDDDDNDDDNDDDDLLQYGGTLDEEIEDVEDIDERMGGGWRKKRKELGGDDNDFEDDSDYEDEKKGKKGKTKKIGEWKKTGAGNRTFSSKKPPPGIGRNKQLDFLTHQAVNEILTKDEHKQLAYFIADYIIELLGEIRNSDSLPILKDIIQLKYLVISLRYHLSNSYWRQGDLGYKQYRQEALKREMKDFMGDTDSVPVLFFSTLFHCEGSSKQQTKESNNSNNNNDKNNNSKKKNKSLMTSYFQASTKKTKMDTCNNPDRNLLKNDGGDDDNDDDDGDDNKNNNNNNNNNTKKKASKKKKGVIALNDDCDDDDDLGGNKEKTDNRVFLYSVQQALNKLIEKTIGKEDTNKIDDEEEGSEVEIDMKTWKSIATQLNKDAKIVRIQTNGEASLLLRLPCHSGGTIDVCRDCLGKEKSEIKPMEKSKLSNKSNKKNNSNTSGAGDSSFSTTTDYTTIFQGQVRSSVLRTSFKRPQEEWPLGFKMNKEIYSIRNENVQSLFNRGKKKNNFTKGEKSKLISHCKDIADKGSNSIPSFNRYREQEMFFFK